MRAHSGNNRRIVPEGFMSVSATAALQPVRLFLRAAFLAGAVLLTGCATHYVDGAVKDISASEFVRPAQPKPVQVVFEFQTKGVVNANATALVKPMVMERIKSAGIFADAQDRPLPGAGLLSVTVNNVALTDDAYAKGFMTGLTFGMAGSTVTDGYLCTVSYMPPGQTTPIIKSAKHAIHTALGASGAPPNGLQVAGIDEAVRMMIRQVMGVALNDLSHDPSFK
jgi:predicted small secreted protein